MVCGKETYCSKEAAQAAIDFFAKTRERGAPKHMHYYYCKGCEGYHLTSWTRELRKTNKTKRNKIQEKYGTLKGKQWTRKRDR